MKKFLNGMAALTLSAAMVVSMTACDDDDKPNVETNNDELYQSILVTYVETTIVPTYKALAEAALEMRTANEALKQNPTDAAMKSASDAWMKARIEWEKSEAFLFGPVGENALDIDGHIDSWPLELENIKKVLADGALGLTGEKAWNMDPEEIGFHVTEYLLYRDGKARPVADMDEAQLNYLTAATDALVWDCVLAYVAWVGEANVSATMREVFNENPDVVAHLNKNADYKEFAKALTTKTGIYASSSWAAALEEISGGAAEIAGEVAEQKIAAPYDDKRVEDVESWYSWHSLDDYLNNIHSIKNAYFGGVSESSRSNNSLSKYLAEVDPALDSKLQAQIEDCIAKIKNIGKDGKSFYEVVRDQTNKEEVDAAVEACSELEQLFAGVADVIE
ncbi:hypothetical protein LJC35_00505 [Parabacteroides sp. OttesenSCG-928-N08]|nr:hypothetical protein [Parabacteroides sp. OttesenSCG-928-N08]